MSLECLASLRIGVVEDESLISMLIEDALVDTGAQIVMRASTVDAALTLIEQERPDAITLDGNLEGELSGRVARFCRERSIRCLVVTGYAEQTLADPDLAAAPRLNKPFTERALVAAAAEHLC